MMSSIKVVNTTPEKERRKMQTADHSNNLPRHFEKCENCGKKGVYTTILKHQGSEPVYLGTERRCKYCGKASYD